MTRKQFINLLINSLAFACQIPGISALLNIENRFDKLQTRVIIILTSFIGAALCVYISTKSLWKPLTKLSINLMITIICWAVLVFYVS